MSKEKKYKHFNEHPPAPDPDPLLYPGYLVPRAEMPGVKKRPSLLVRALQKLTKKD